MNYDVIIENPKPETIVGKQPHTCLKPEWHKLAELDAPHGKAVLYQCKKCGFIQ